MSVKKKSLVGWTWNDWRSNFKYRGNILDSFNAIYKFNQHTPKTDLRKVRITIEEVK